MVVGNGQPFHAAAFRDEQSIDFPLVVDPSLKAYRAAGLKRGWKDTLAPKAIGHAIRAWKSGARQTSVKGDPWQLGGTFVLEAGGKLLFRHVSREAGDHPSVGEVLAALPPALPFPPRIP